ncbi:MAG: reverse transcriptase domain-containing protein [bacterium]
MSEPLGTQQAAPAVVSSDGSDPARLAFLAMKEAEDVAELVGFPPKRLNFILYGMKGSSYVTFKIPKRFGGHRTIEAPATALKTVQRRLADVLNRVYSPGPAVHGFALGRNVKTNARLHTNREWVLNVDLKDFFPSINFGRVRAMFLKWPYGLPKDVATMLAQICCNDGHLPQGAPTSPIVANMICARMDSQLRQVAERYRCTYSRYADDITISHPLRRFPEPLAILPGHGISRVGRLLGKVLADNGFEVNEKKVRLQHRSTRQEVTGLVVNDVINVRREFVRQIRSMLHAWECYGVDSAQAHFQRTYVKHRKPGREPPAFRDVLRGKLRYLVQIKGRDSRVVSGLVERARRCSSEFQRIPISKDALWIVSDDVRTGRQGTAFHLRGFGIVTCWHALADDSVLLHSDITRVVRHPLVIERSNKDLDLALLSSMAPAIHEFPRGDDASVKEGDTLTIFGFPNWVHGQEVQKLSVRVMGRQQRFGTNRIVVDIPVVGGMSGGPALDSNGRVVGVVLTGYFGAEGGNRVGNQLQPISALDELLRLPLEASTDPPAADEERISDGGRPVTTEYMFVAHVASRGALFE